MNQISVGTSPVVVLPANARRTGIQIQNLSHRALVVMPDTELEKSLAQYDIWDGSIPGGVFVGDVICVRPDGPDNCLVHEDVAAEAAPATKPAATGATPVSGVIKND